MPPYIDSKTMPHAMGWPESPACPRWRIHRPRVALLVRLTAIAVVSVALSTTSTAASQSEPTVPEHRVTHTGNTVDDADLPPWQEEQTPDWASDPDRQPGTYRVRSLSIGLPTEPGAAVDLQRYSEALADMAKYFGIPLRIVAPLANFATVRMDIEHPIDATEAAQRCRRMVRFGLAESCRPLSPAGGLM